MKNTDINSGFAVFRSASVQPRPIGIFGGTFDPPHLGHTGLAEQIVGKCGLEKIIFVPSFSPPHKPDRPLSSFEHRVRMLKIALHDQPCFELSTIEAELEKPSYTFRTMEYLSGKFPNSELCLIIGSDSLLQLHTWFKARELVESWRIICYSRPKHEANLRELSKIWGEKIASRLYNAILYLKFFDMSSSDIKRMIANGEDCRGLLAPDVREYASANRLYEKIKEI